MIYSTILKRNLSCCPCPVCYGRVPGELQLAVCPALAEPSVHVQHLDVLHVSLCIAMRDTHTHTKKGTDNPRLHSNELDLALQ